LAAGGIVVSARIRICRLRSRCRSLRYVGSFIHKIRSQQRKRNTSVERGADAAQRQLSVDHISHQKGQHGNTDIEHNGDQELIGKNQPSGQPSGKSTDPLGIGFSREYGLLAAAPAAYHAFGKASIHLAEGSRPNAECRCSGPQARQEAA